MKEDLIKIINYYGEDKQLKYIHSEYFELDEAIINYWNDETYYEEIEKSDKKHIAEEIADVMVMLKQFQYFYEITDKNIEDIMKQKISRQLERIENEIKNIGLN
jgi:NTP pyrophosphatase (non-canonical NTP hydrolase)